MLGKQLAAAELGDEHSVLPLDDLDANIVVADALFIDWPRFDACIGNPPYLGRRRLIQERGAEYSSELGHRFPEVGGVSDYVAYWFRLAHDRMKVGDRAGLVGTNTIRQTDTRKVSLDYILDHGGTITDAWSSIPWSGEAAVSVSIVNWTKGPSDEPAVLWLDEGQRKVVLPTIVGDLSEHLDLRSAVDLSANKQPKVFFQGQTPGHNEAFVLTTAQAEGIVNADPKSREVIFPYLIGDELLHTFTPGRWVIDIDAEDATKALALAPGAFQRLQSIVLPTREAKAAEEAAANERALEANPRARVNWHHRGFLARWWQHSYRREEFLDAISPLDRFITVPATASENRKPVFMFVSTAIHPSHALQCFAFDDDYSLGILQSSLHEQWFRRRCSTLEERLRYTSKTVFGSYPWPQHPSQESVDAVVASVSEILRIRETRLEEGVSLAGQYDTLRVPGVNVLRDAHDRLDEAVFDAYGFDTTRPVLDQLLELNLELAARERKGEAVRGPGGTGLRNTRITQTFVPAPALP
jgi:hypothetical protein